MELDHDDFIVDYDASRITVEELLKACKQSGYPGTVVDSPTRVSATRENSDAELPRFYIDALARAKNEQKPIVLDFGAKWCVPCQRMEIETLKDSRVESLLERCIFLKVDADEHTALIAKFGVTGLPDVRFLSADGSELRRLVDFQTAESFSKELQVLLSTSP